MKSLFLLMFVSIYGIVYKCKYLYGVLFVIAAPAAFDGLLTQCMLTGNLPPVSPLGPQACHPVCCCMPAA